MEALFQRLAPLDAATRETELTEIGRDAPGLGHEVADLLASHDSFGVLDRLTARLSPEPVTSVTPVAPLTGTRVRQYEIGELVGRGGMGDVYRGYDTRLGREVALKFLPTWLGLDPAAHDRFVVEARIVSAIDHPNVCTLHELGETDDGQLFIVMPFYEGETLKRRLARGALAPGDAVKVALQAARGLAAAHERGIVHRDVKPANLLLTDDGRLKILDFGVAKLADIALTRPGERPGTTCYMAPEQAAGGMADARSDLWSLGAVLHEMLSGRLPPSGSSAVGGPAVPPRLSSIVSRLLAPDPADRYEDAESLAADLLDAAKAPDALRVRSGRRRLIVAAGVAVGVLAAVAGWLAPGATDPPADPGVVVMPFRVSGAGLDYLREGLSDLMSINFDGAAGLRKIDFNSTMTAWNERVGQNRDAASADEALDVARSLGAEYAVLGSVVQTGSGTVRVQAEGYDVESGDLRGAVHEQGSPDSLAQLIDGLTLELLRRGIVPADGDGALPNLSRVTTSSLPALKSFLAGESAYRHGRWREAAAFYREAVGRDSLFARAWYRLGWSMVWSSQPAGESFRRAAGLAAGLPERDSLLMTVMALPEVERLKMLTTLTTRYPDDPDGWFIIGDGIFHAGGLLFRPAVDYLGPLRRAVSLAPTYEETSLHLFEDAFLRYDRERVDDLLRITAADGTSPRSCPGFPWLRDMRWGPETSATRAADRLEDSYEGPQPGCIWAAAAADPRAVEIAERHELPFILPGAPFASPARFWRMVHARVATGHLKRARELPEIVARSDYEYLRTQARQYAVTLELPPYATDTAATRRALERLRSTPRSEEAPQLKDFWLAVAAAEEDRRPEFASAVARIDSIAGADGEDGPDAARMGAYARVLTAYRDVRTGDFDRLEAFEAGMAALDPDGWLTASPSQYLRFQVGRTLLSASRLRDAERYFRSLYPYSWYFVPAQLELGRTYEKLAEPDLARERYRVVVEAWAMADKELRPAVEEARSALARLR